LGRTSCAQETKEVMPVCYGFMEIAERTLLDAKRSTVTDFWVLAWMEPVL